MKRYISAHPVISLILACLSAGLLFSAIFFVNDLVSPYTVDLSDVAIVLITGILVIGVGIMFPVLISAVNLLGVFLWLDQAKTFRIFSIMTLVVGGILTYLFSTVIDIQWVDWDVQLYNSSVHAPICSGGMLSLAVVVVPGVVAYFILSLRRADELPPLLIVLCMSAMYLWAAVCVLWCVQISGGKAPSVDLIPLCVLPLNCILLILRVIRVKILEWNSTAESHAQKEWTDPFNRLLQNAECWSTLALAATLPMLGVLVCVLALFGQAPDTLIRAFTETSDWRLSEKVGPQNIYYDEHYLCTVAAGGDRRVVKPLRMGERHGHRVIVNRQLQIANAFEQVLEERVPKTHRVIRHIYDTYGFPLSKIIRTKRACDLVYFLMKPLEWFFLIVLYLTDVHPEDRIAVQYLPRKSRADR